MAIVPSIDNISLWCGICASGENNSDTVKCTAVAVGEDLHSARGGGNKEDVAEGVMASAERL